MSAGARALSVLALTLGLLAGLLYLNPFRRASDALVGAFGAAPSTAQVELLYTDEATQETTHGEDPAVSFAALARRWGAETGKRRVVLIGNSQTYHVVLAPGERASGSPEKTYPDLVADHYRGAPGAVEVYRLSAPNLTYMEALWYLERMAGDPALRPTTVALQLNYETLRKTGIRDGFLPMLDDGRFEPIIRGIAAAEEPYASLFQEALVRRAEALRARQAAPGSGDAAASSHTGIAQAEGWGNRLETALRKHLDRARLLDRRSQIKGDLLNLLYLGRVYLLGIKPTSPRPLGHGPLVMNGAALRSIADLCAREHIRLVLFNAPQNPSSPLYRTQADKAAYDGAIHGLATERQLPLYDFERDIPQREWGAWIDGPDPIHFGLEAHRRMATRVIESGMLEERR